MNEPAIHLVDDDAGVRAALTFLLQTHGLAVQAHADGPALLRTLDAQPAPPRGVFLLDVRMAPMGGTELHEELLRRRLDNPVLFLTGHGDIPMAVAALRKGAFDFLEKPWVDGQLVEHLRHALAVEAASHEQHAQSAQRAARLASLSPRERDVMRLIVAGKLNKVIADDLKISMRTVEIHRARVFAKLGVRTAAEMAALVARESGPI